MATTDLHEISDNEFISTDLATSARDLVGGLEQ